MVTATHPSGGRGGPLLDSGYPSQKTGSFRFTSSTHRAS